MITTVLQMTTDLGSNLTVRQTSRVEGLLKKKRKEKRYLKINLTSRVPADRAAV